MDEKDKLEIVRSKIRENSLGISRIPINTKQEFIELANQEFESDYGMTLKYLLDHSKETSMTDLIALKVIELEQRISFLEGKPKSKEIKLCGKTIRIGGKECQD